MPDYPCVVCGETVTYKREPNKGKQPRHEKCRDRENNKAAWQREKAATSVPNKPGEGVRFTAVKTKKTDARLDKLSALYLQLTDESGKPVYHADRCDYLRLAAAFVELKAPESVKRCEKLYERMAKK